MATFKIIHRPNQHHDANALDDVLDYCQRDKKTPSGLIFGRNVDVDYAASEMNDVAAAYGKDSGLRLRHSVLSFAPDEEIAEIEAAEIAQRAMDYYSEQYQIVAAIHEDSDDPHVHFVMNQVSYKDGSRYRGKKDDYYRFQHHLKDILSSYGINKLVIGSSSSED